jgi:hypothetical protein
MKMRMLGAAALLSLVITGVAIAGDGKLLAQPFKFDPNNTGAAVAHWQAKIGLPDVGNARQGLRLEKNAPTTEIVAAGANLKFVEGEPFEQMGFDISNDSPCTGGSPRFNVLASDGFHFVGGCGNDNERTAVPGHPDWTRVRFESDEAFPPIAPGATIISAQLIVDEEGKYRLDNIYVNGDWARKAGANTTRKARR